MTEVMLNQWGGNARRALIGDISDSYPASEILTAGTQEWTFWQARVASVQVDVNLSFDGGAFVGNGVTGGYRKNVSGESDGTELELLFAHSGFVAGVDSPVGSWRLDMMEAAFHLDQSGGWSNAVRFAANQIDTSISYQLRTFPQVGFLPSGATLVLHGEDPVSGAIYHQERSLFESPVKPWTGTITVSPDTFYQWANRAGTPTYNTDGTLAIV